MKRRLILHLGLSKTGTTSIQGFFRQNPEALAAAGIIYPRVSAAMPDHPAFRRSALKARRNEETNHSALALEINGGREGAGDAGDRTPLWSAAFRQIDDSGARTAIVSYENFSIRPTKYRFDDIAGRIGGFNVLGIIYLRRQEDWAISLYGQKVKGAGRFAKDFSRYASSLGGRLIYSRILDEIKGHFPLDRLVVGNFDQAANTGLLEDFLDRAGLPRERLMSGVEQRLRNPSRSHGATLFLLKCNQAALPDDAFLRVRKALAADGPRDVDFGLRPGLDMAAPDERRAMREATAKDADRLLERYGVSLSAETRAPIAYRPFDEEDFNTIRQAIAPRLPTATREALETIQVR
ncbi:MAG: hypothetical protein H0X27_14325 [Caulobacteraceae bacterium]|nr:hypothetical protein [Caulobacteraceae bacterium]